MVSGLLTLLLMALSAAFGVAATLWMRREPGRPAGMRPVPPPDDGPPPPNGALALVDLDRLAAVNAANDYDTGDRLLDAVGDTLRRGLPPGTGLERLESGRFLLWLPDLAPADARGIVDDLRRLAGLTVVEGSRGKVGCSASAAVVRTVAGEARPRAILRADAAMSRAKGLGGNRTQVHEGAAMPSLAPPRSEIEAAIAARALTYHVQPIFDLRGGEGGGGPRAVGVEALLRWNRSDGSVVGPAGFMDTLNRIPEAGSDLLSDLAAEVALPFMTGPTPRYVTFNVTGAVLDGTGSAACRWLSRLMERVPPEHLVLEIVETAVIVAPERAGDLIDRLRARGVRIALDDFGTGLSNLERLRRFPVDLLKIDRAFVGGMGREGREEAILRSLATLTGGLGIDCIAEGIETAEELATLRGIGIHYAQGFHLGRPGPVPDWAERLTGSG